MKAVQTTRAPISGAAVRKAVTRTLLSAAMLAATSSAFAGAEIKMGDDAGVSVGMGLRGSYTSAERGAPNGSSRSSDFSLENARLYLGAHYGSVIKATFNTERTGGTSSSGGDNIRVMDAIMQFEFMPEFNIWMGRMLPPSDRANLYGPFFALPWSYPGVASNYPQLAVGRDNGVMVWGKPFKEKLVYSVGIFEGHNRAANLSNNSDKLLYAGRLAFNIWDPEPAPAHYTGGWYGGSKDIFTVALAGFSQNKGVGTAAKPGNLTVWNTDVLLEKKFDAGVPTFEGAYYKYKVGAVDCGTGEPGSVPCASGANNVGGQVDGKSYLLGAAFLIGPKVGWGQFQPFVRYQKYDRSLSHTSVKQMDYGVNYVIKGPNAKVTLMYSKIDDNQRLAPLNSLDQIVLGVQLQY